MKKIFGIILSLALIISVSFPVCAYNEAVTITSASGNTSTVSVSGTTNALAVAVQVRSGGTIVAMNSTGVSGNNFSISLTGLSLTAGDTVTVYVADYEGGTWSTQDIVVASGGTGSGGSSPSGLSIPGLPDIPPDQIIPAPKTGFRPPFGLMALISLCLVSGAGCIIYSRKRG
ncbi:MAG: hypothetical protein J6U41_09790 [Lachnospiraceae bacterium]|nr:hypothetical protein [Lachnospiraceae bacterium]MBP5702192.1 hypothetical protein [Lachnospiraceae bacterium]MBP5762017.1 hypothetical protein [Lachnospiraceae bacterium]